MMRMLWLALVVALPLAAGAQTADRPDVLFIAVDDLNDWVGFLAGHPQVQTPNIDRLAARGLAFTNAHSPSALCNPSRTALLSGLRPATTGIYGNAPDWRTVDVFAAVQTLPRYFRENGWRTLGAGKIFHAHTFGPDGFAGFNDRRAWDAFYPSIERQLPDEVGPARRPFQRTGIPGFDWAAVVVDDEAMGDGQVASYAIRQLEAASDGPRFIAVGLYRPHLPWYVPQKYLDLYPLDEIVLPEVIENDLDDVPPPGHTSRFRSRESHEWILQEGRWRDAVQAYLASITFVDTMVGRLLDALDASGRADRTIVMLWGDHGYHLGEKERWHKETLWEESTRVPLIVVAPGVTQPGTRTDRPVSLMDMYPTLAELAALDVPSHIEGRSLVPLLENPRTRWDYPAVTTYGFNNHAVRTERYRYIRYSDGSEELYDHEADPNEWTNLAGDPAQAALIGELGRWLPTTNAADRAETVQPGSP